MRLLLLVVFVLQATTLFGQDTNQLSTQDLVDKINAFHTINDSLGFNISSNSLKLLSREKGEIYLKNNDTLYGEVKIKISPHIPIKVIFRDTITQKSKTFRADKIIGFQKGNREFYTKRTETRAPFFIEKATTGEITIYSYRYVSQGSDGFKQTVKEFYIDGKDGYIKQVKCEDLLRFIKEKFSNRPDFVDVLTDNKSGINKIIYNDKTEFNTCDYLIEIVQLYNLLSK